MLSGDIGGPDLPMLVDIDLSNLHFLFKQIFDLAEAGEILVQIFDLDESKRNMPAETFLQQEEPDASEICSSLLPRSESRSQNGPQSNAEYLRDCLTGYSSRW